MQSELYSHPKRGALSTRLPRPRSPWRVSHFLPVCMCLWWTFHLHGVMQPVAFCVWLVSLSTVSSRSVQREARVSTSFLFVADCCPLAWIHQSVHPLSTHQRMDTWVCLGCCEPCTLFLTLHVTPICHLQVFKPTGNLAAFFLCIYHVKLPSVSS